MADDLHLRYIDRFFIALKEDYEVRDFEKSVKQQRPSATSTQIHDALIKCAAQFASNHPRAQIMECVLKRLG
jgi:hypothetical protein